MFDIQEDEEFWEELPLDELDRKAWQSRTNDALPRHVVCNPGHPIKLSGSSAVNISGPYKSSEEINGMVLITSSCDNRAADTKAIQDKEKGCADRLPRVPSKRRFPGPAGILPQLPPQRVVPGPSPSSAHPSPCSSPSVTALQADSPTSAASTVKQLYQDSGDALDSSVLWQTLTSDLGSDASSVLTTFSIKSLLSKATRRRLPRGKAPLVLAMIQSLEFCGNDGSAVLVDPSGKIRGAIHRELIQDPVTALQEGWVLVLRQVSVISPSGRIHYLNVTPGNVALVYRPSRDSATPHRTAWSPTASTATSPLSGPPLSSLVQQSRSELITFASPITPRPTNARFAKPGMSVGSRPTAHPSPSLYNTVTPRNPHNPTFRNGTPMVPSLPHLPAMAKPFATPTRSTRPHPYPAHSTHQPSPAFTKGDNSCSISKPCPNPPPLRISSLSASNLNTPVSYSKSSGVEVEDTFFEDDDDDILSMCGEDGLDVSTSVSPPWAPSGGRERKDVIPAVLMGPLHPQQSAHGVAVAGADQTVNQARSETETEMGRGREVGNKFGSRDSRVQLGVSSISKQTMPPAQQSLGDGMDLWDDDLSEDLLSQLG